MLPNTSFWAVSKTARSMQSPVVATNITIVNRWQDCRPCTYIPLELASTSLGKDTARIPAKYPMYDDDQKAKDWLFLVFTSSVARQITWKS